MGQPDDWRPLALLIGDQQPPIDQRPHQAPSRIINTESFEGRCAPNGNVDASAFFGRHLHERSKHLRQSRLDFWGQRRDNRLGAMPDRALHAAELLIGGVGEESAGGPALVQFFEGEFQERKTLGVAARRRAEDLVERDLCVRIFLVGQPSRLRRLANHLSDLGRSRQRQRIVP